MKRIFISHPYADDPIENMKSVDAICKSLENVLPISPLHLFSYMEDDSHRREILEVCYRMIDMCDEVWIYGNSDGCFSEYKYAIQRNKKVRMMY